MTPVFFSRDGVYNESLQYEISLISRQLEINMTQTIIMQVSFHASPLFACRVMVTLFDHRENFRQTQRQHIADVTYINLILQ